MNPKAAAEHLIKLEDLPFYDLVPVKPIVKSSISVAKRYLEAIELLKRWYITIDDDLPGDVEKFLAEHEERE